MRLSETDRGQRWLQNFLPEDVSAARLLLDSLRIISETTFRARLTERLLQAVRESDSPIALYPVRPAPPRAKSLMNFGDKWIEPQPDRPYDPTAGSEHLVAAILRDVARNASRGVTVRNIPTLSEIKLGKFRTIMLVDDYAGSGDSVVKYAAAWFRNPTIRSWKSYKLISLKFASYAISTQAREAIEKDAKIDSPLHWVEFGVDFFTAPWDGAQLQEIRDLCYNYAQQKKFAYGWGDTASLFAMAHTVPNNLPAILLQKRGPAGEWFPFFSGRSMSDEQQLEFQDVSPVVDYFGKAANLGQTRLGRAIEILPENPYRQLLLIIASLSRGRKKEDQLAEQLGFPLHEVHNCLLWAHALQIIDSDNRLTDLGWQELQQARDHPKIPRTSLQGSDAPYYPLSLRGAQ